MSGAQRRTPLLRKEHKSGLLRAAPKGSQAAAAEVEKAGGTALTLPLDVADPDAIEAAAERVEDHFGPIDIWVNCAMATIFAPFHRISPKSTAGPPR